MSDQKYILNHLASIFHTGIFCLQEEQLISYEENPEYNPVYNNEGFRLTLTSAADAQAEPVVAGDEFQVFYICVKWKHTYYIMGPFCTQVMSRTERHRFYHFYGVEEKWEKGLHYYTLMEILQTAGLFTKIISGREYTDQQLVDANYHAVASMKEQEEMVCFDIKSQDEDIYRHTYQEERRILDAVKEGNVEEAVRLSKEMDSNIGRLGESEVEHWRNLSIVAATICARAAIEGALCRQLHTGSVDFILIKVRRVKTSRRFWFIGTTQSKNWQRRCGSRRRSVILPAIRSSARIMYMVITERRFIWTILQIHWESAAAIYHGCLKKKPESACRTLSMM